MSKEAPPSRTAPQFIVRMPDDEFRNKIAEAAKSNNRSMNAEIVARLEQSFSEDPGALASLLKVQTVLTKTMAQFVMSAVDITGPHKGLNAEVLHAMRELAEQAKAGDMVSREEPFERLYLMMAAMMKVPEGRNLEEFVYSALRHYEEQKSQMSSATPAEAGKKSSSRPEQASTLGTGAREIAPEPTLPFGAVPRLGTKSAPPPSADPLFGATPARKRKPKA